MSNYTLTKDDIKSLNDALIAPPTSALLGRMSGEGDYIRFAGRCPICNGAPGTVRYNAHTGNVYCSTPGCYRGKAPFYMDRIGAAMSDGAKDWIYHNRYDLSAEEKKPDLPGGIVSAGRVADADMDTLDKFETPWQTLNRRLSGGIYLPGYTVISGKRGEGKSTMAANLIAKAVSAGFKTFVYSGELSKELVSTSIKRVIAGPEHITAVGDAWTRRYIIDDDANAVIQDYIDDKVYLYDIKTIDVRDDDGKLFDIMTDAADRLGCRVMLIDNLMTALDDDLSLDAYRQQAVFAKRLAAFCQDKQAMVLLVVHPRKTPNGQSSSNDDIGGSSVLTDRADYIIFYERIPGEQYRDELGLIKTADNSDDPRRRIKLTKNRLTGDLLAKGVELDFDNASTRIYEASAGVNAGWYFWGLDLPQKKKS